MQVQLILLSVLQASSADLDQLKLPQLFVIQAATVAENQLVALLIAVPVLLVIIVQAQQLNLPFSPFLAHKERTEQQRVQSH